MAAPVVVRGRPFALSPTGVLLALTFAAAVGLYFAGIWQNLPYAYEADEPTRVTRAVTMVANADPNPHWFGHPASTVFYPLALLISVWNVVACGGSFWQPNPALQRIFAGDIAPFYLLGRLVTIVYGLLSLPVVYAIGRRVFGERTALLALWFVLTYTIVTSHAQVARSDSAALFFAMLSLWLCLRFHDRPTGRNRVFAGLAVGLAIASRYFMAAFVLPLLAAEAALLWRQRQRGHQLRVGSLVAPGAGMLAVFAGFALSTPFFFLDFQTALRDLLVEARVRHVGFDGLSPAGNFLWYVTKALPEAAGWFCLPLAVAALLVAVRHRRHLQMLLGAFVLTYVVGISLHPLHEQRWLIQVLPLVALLDAEAVVFFSGLLAGRLALKGGQATALYAVLVVAVLGVPAYDMALFEIRQVNPSTRVQAMMWMEAFLPASSRVAVERYGPPQVPGKFDYVYSGSLGQDREVDDYRREKVDYLVVTDEIYNRYLAEPERYGNAVAFYNEVFSTLPLVAEFVPSPVRPGLKPKSNVSAVHPGTGGGPIVRIYRLED